MDVRRHFSRTLPLLRHIPAVKPCARKKAIAEDRSGEGTRRREDTWACKDTSRRQVGRGHASSRRHVGGRRYRRQVGRRPASRRRHMAGEDTSRRQVGRRHMGGRRHFPKTCRDAWAGEDTSRRQVGRRHASLRRHVGGRRQVGRRHPSSQRDVGDTSSDDSRNRERQCVLNCKEVLSVVASRQAVSKSMPNAFHDGTAT